LPRHHVHAFAALISASIADAFADGLAGQASVIDGAMFEMHPKECR